MGQPIQFRRGNKPNLPNLNNGEPAFVQDEKDLYVGTPNGNQLIGGKSVTDKFDQVDEQLAQIAHNVMSFGAKGDGVTDDTQAFIDANAQGNRLIVPKGKTFIVDNLTLNNVELMGGGTIKWKAASTTKMIEFNGTFNVENIVFNGNSENQDGINRSSILLNTSPNSTFRKCEFTNFKGKLINSDVSLSPNVTIENCVFHNTTFLSNGNVMDIRSSKWRVLNNTFSNIGKGHCIRLGLYDGDGSTTPVKNTLISGNSFEDTKHNAITLEIYTEDTTISNNFFNNNPQAIKAESANGTVKKVLIYTNHFKDILISTALNLSVPDVTFVNNICENLGGGAYFGTNFICSNNKFYRCGNGEGTNGYSISDIAGARGVIENNQIYDSKYDAIRSRSSDVRGNVIINPVNDGIRLSEGNANVSGNYIEGAKNGIVLVSTVVNSVISGNIIRNVMTPISFSNNENYKTNKVISNVGVAEVETSGVRSVSIVSDAITVRDGDKLLILGTEGGESIDDLNMINGGTAGQMLTIVTTSVSRHIVVKNNVNIRLAGSDFTLDSTVDSLTLLYTGYFWIEISRSDNGS